jgi:hypothetical protein
MSNPALWASTDPNDPTDRAVNDWESTMQFDSGVRLGVLPFKRKVESFGAD